MNTGSEVRDSIVRENVRVTTNGTTDVIVDGLIDYSIYPDPHVLAARVWIGDRIVSRDVDWPQPLKYLDFSDRGLEVETGLVEPSTGTCKSEMTVRAKKPVKCLAFEERDGVRLGDNAVDVVPGDEQVVVATGLKREDGPLKWKYCT